MTHFWPVFGLGYASGLAVEKWFVWFGHPDRTTVMAWLCTAAATGIGILLVIEAQREEGP